MGVGDRDDGSLAKFLIQRHQIGNVQTPMQRRKVGYKLAAREGKVQIVDMEVDDIETCGLFENQSQHQDMVRWMVHALLV
jgi:hypothetical protein